MLRKIMAFLILRDKAKQVGSSKVGAFKAGRFAAQAVQSMNESLKTRSHWSISATTFSLFEAKAAIERQHFEDRLTAFAALNGLKVPSTETEGFNDPKSRDEK